MTYLRNPYKESEPVISNTDVIQDLRTLMQFPEDLTDLDTLNFFAALGIQFTMTSPSWYDYFAPRSTEAYFLSVCLDDSDSDLSDYYSNSGDEGADMDDE